MHLSRTLVAVAIQSPLRPHIYVIKHESWDERARGFTKDFGFSKLAPPLGSASRAKPA